MNYPQKPEEIVFKIGCALMIAGTLMAGSAVAAGSEKEKPMGELSFDMAGRLFQLHAGEEKDSQNLVFSPTSIYLALSMTGEGARGDTATQMRKALGQDASPDAKAHKSIQSLLIGLGSGGPLGESNNANKYTLTLTNRLWLDKAYTVEPAFSDIVEKNYFAEIAPVDFLHAAEAGRKTINDAIAKQTKDKIKDLLPPGAVNVDTRLVLTNAVYFKAAWDKPFRKNLTTPWVFNELNGTVTKDVLLMHQTETLRFFEDDQLKVVELPYKGNALSMLLVLSKDKDATKSLEIEKSLADLPKWVEKLANRHVALAMPKFKFESQMELTEDLKTLGMTDAFSGKADFSGITTKEKIVISGVIHKAFIDVNEEGTEAAAATAVMMKGMAMRQNPEAAEFIADRPFLFAIRDNQSGEILFLGRMVKP